MKDSIVDQETAAAVSNWGDGPKPVVEDKPEKADESTETAAEEAAPEPEDNQLSLDEYLKQKEAAQQALLAKMGIAPAKPAESAESAEAAATPSAAPAQTSRKGTKAVDVNEVFRVRLPPVGGDRDERPRGRGGRGMFLSLELIYLLFCWTSVSNLCNRWPRWCPWWRCPSR